MMKTINEPSTYAQELGEKGMATVIIIAVIIIITGFVATYIAISTNQQKQVDSSIEEHNYYSCALSGLDMARAYLCSTYTADTIGWDNELKKSADNLTTYVPSTPSIPQPASLVTFTSWFQWCRNIDYYGNTYFAKIENNNDGGGALNDTDSTLKITVYGWGGGNDPLKRSQEIMLEAMVSYKIDLYQPQGALVVGGSLRVYGNASITGSDGDIQANGPVTITGSSSIAGDVTSTGAIVAPPGSIGGVAIPNAPPTPIPPIAPSDYRYLGTHIFKTDGKVYDQNNNLIATPAGWAYTAATQTWSKSGNDTDAGVFYFEGSNVNITSSPGSPATPWQVSIIATGYIDMSGSPTIAPNASGGNIACMAGKDLKMRGSSSTALIGLFAAHEQVSLVGNPAVNGCVIAEDKEDLCSLVSSSSLVDVEIGGSANINYNGGLSTVLKDGYPYIKILGFKKNIQPKY